MGLIEIIQTGGVVAVVGAFLWYLYQRNGKQENAMKGITDALGTLHSSQERHTRVLMKVANNHGLNETADDLIEGKE